MGPPPPPQKKKNRAHLSGFVRPSEADRHRARNCPDLKQPSSHFCTELSKTQFFPVSIVKSKLQIIYVATYIALFLPDFIDCFLICLVSYIHTCLYYFLILCFYFHLLFLSPLASRHILQFMVDLGSYL